MKRDHERRRGKLDYGRLTMRDKMRERGFENVAGKLPADLRSWPPRPPQPTKQQQRAEADRAIAVWRATRTSS
jgi:hypothetical protein